MLQTVSELMRDWYSSTTTSAGAAGGTTTIDTGLAGKSADPGYFTPGWVRYTTLADSNTGLIRPVSAYDGVSELTHLAFPAQVGSGKTFEYHRYDPQVKLDAIKAASARAFPGGNGRGLYLPKVDETLIVDNLLLNGGFDAFSTTFTSWTNIGTPTLAQEATRIFGGLYSASITAAGGVEGIKQDIFSRINVRDSVGKTLNVQIPVWCATANVARVRVTLNGSTYTNSAYHPGGGKWVVPTDLAIAVAIPSGATEATVSCEVADGYVAYFGKAATWVDPVYTYTKPSSILRGPFQVHQQANRDQPQGIFLPIKDYGVPTPGHILRLTGMGMISQPTTDAGTVEIGEPHVQLFLAYALHYCYQVFADEGPSAERDYLYKRRDYWKDEIARMEASSRYTMAPLLAELPGGVWEVKNDTLYFVQPR